MKTEIFTFVFNRPDILDYQIKSIKKFFVGDFDINVVYDTRDNQYFDEFRKICEDNSTNFYNHISKHGQSPSQYHGESVQWVYDNLIINTKGNFIGMFLDHDMFLIDKFNLVEELEKYDVAGCLQTRKNIKYFWPGIFMFKKSSVENIKFDFYPQTVDGQMLDTGGGTYKLLAYESIKFLDTGVEYPEEYNDIDLTDESVVGKYGYELHYRGKFLHFRNACNWHNNYVTEDGNKTEVLKKILGDFL